MPFYPLFLCLHVKLMDLLQLTTWELSFALWWTDKIHFFTTSSRPVYHWVKVKIMPNLYTDNNLLTISFVAQSCSLLLDLKQYNTCIKTQVASGGASSSIYWLDWFVYNFVYIVYIYRPKTTKLAASWITVVEAQFIFVHCMFSVFF